MVTMSPIEHMLVVVVPVMVEVVHPLVATVVVTSGSLVMLSDSDVVSVSVVVVVNRVDVARLVQEDITARRSRLSTSGAQSRGEEDQGH